MRIIANENVSSTVIQELRRRGHDVLSVKELMRAEKEISDRPSSLYPRAFTPASISSPLHYAEAAKPKRSHPHTADVQVV